MSSDEVGALKFGHRTFSGCVVLALSGLLQQFKVDIAATETEWNQSAPVHHGFLFGQIIIAAANGVRHVDEWEAARVPSGQQQRSMRVLEAVLGNGSAALFRVRDLPAATLARLSENGDFEQLAASVFAFVHNVAISRDARQ